MKKNVVSLVLSAALLFSTFSIPAFAAETEAAPEVLPEAAAAQPEETAPETSEAPAAEENASSTTSSDEIVIVLPSASASSESTADSKPETEAKAETKPEETPAASAASSSAASEKPEAETKPAADSKPETETKPETEATAPVAEKPKKATSKTASENPNSFTYVALGDSICSGVGLVQMENHGTSMMGVDVSFNFKGYPAQCYVGQLASVYNLDRDHAINLGLPALMSSDLVDLLRDGKMNGMNMLSGCEYNYPQMREYLKQADVISIQIGSNDALVPCIVGLGNATNWKTEEAASIVLSGDLRTAGGFNALVKSLKKYKLTTAEVNATWNLLTSGMAKICNEAYPVTTANLETIVQTIRELNPDAQIILVGYTNPVPLISCWSKFFSKMNRYEKKLAAKYDLTYVAIPNTKTELDGHPTVSGHKYIARQLTKAIDKANK